MAKHSQEEKEKRTAARGMIFRKRGSSFALVYALALLFLFPCTGFAASLHFSIPASITATKTFGTTFFADARGTAINSAETTLTFPTDKLEISEVSKSGIFTHWPIDPTYSNTTGTLRFAGGLPTPGFNGSSGSLITITFHAKEAGSAKVCPTNSRVLANDSFGTDVLTSASCVTFTILELPVPNPPTVTSSTHPDPTRWFPNARADLAWNLQEGVTRFSYMIDQAPDTVPDESPEGNALTTSFDGLNDGTWYFHIRAQNIRGWGDAAHFTIRVDATAPILSAAIVGDLKTTRTTPDMTYAVSDVSSGVAGLELIIDGGQTYSLPVSGSSYTMPELSIGSHVFVVRARDFAGNVSTVNLAIEIQQPTIINRIIKNITDLVPEALKNVVKNVTQPVAQIVKDIRANEAIVNTTKQLAEPIAATAAAIGITAVVATAPVGLLNAIFSFFRFIYLVFSPIFVRRRRKAWGTVVDSVTGKPMKGVVVRVFETEFQKMKESQMTDEYGRFGFLIEPGNYSLTAQKQGYTFPSKIFEHLKSLPNIYIGGVITVTDKIHHNINVTIPIDPDLSHISARALVWKRVREGFAVFLERINLPLLIAGTGISVWSVVVVPGTLNELLLVLYILLILLKLIRDRSHFRSYGAVLELGTKKPIDLAVVRIFDAVKSSLVATRITNLQGKFSILLRKGEYYLIVLKSPYQPKRTGIMKLSRAKALAADIFLEKSKPGFTPPAFTPPQAPVIRPKASMQAPAPSIPQAPAAPGAEQPKMQPPGTPSLPKAPQSVPGKTDALPPTNSEPSKNQPPAIPASPTDEIKENSKPEIPKKEPPKTA